MQKTRLVKKPDIERLKNQLLQWELDLQKAITDKNHLKVKDISRAIKNTKSCLVRFQQ